MIMGQNGRKRHVLGRIFLGIGLCVGMIYVTGVIVFSSRFGFQTSIDGMSVTGQTPAEVMLDYVQYRDQQVVSFCLPDGSVETATVEQLGLICPGELDIAALEVPGWAWPVCLFKPTEYSVSKQMAYKQGSGFPAFSFVKAAPEDPVDAYAVRSGGGFALVPASEGTALDLHLLREAACQAVEDGTFEVDVVSCYRTADVNVYEGTRLARKGDVGSLVLDLGAGVFYELTEEDWSVFTERKDGLLILDPAAVDQFVAELALKYDTVGTDRKFHTSTGQDVVLTTAGHTDCDFPGWEMDQAYLADMIRVEALSGHDTEVLVPWISQGKSHGESDVGDTYLEISLDAQKMWLYDHGVCLVETDVVTGMKGDPSRETPVGAFQTTDFYTEHTMTGSYGEIFCHYFIRITEDGVGVHDADWRTVFGGDIYQYDGSHGCINTPYEATKAIFDFLSSSSDWTPIIVW